MKASPPVLRNDPRHHLNKAKNRHQKMTGRNTHKRKQKDRDYFLDQIEGDYVTILLESDSSKIVTRHADRKFQALGELTIPLGYNKTSQHYEVLTIKQGMNPDIPRTQAEIIMTNSGILNRFRSGELKVMEQYVDNVRPDSLDGYDVDDAILLVNSCRNEFRLKSWKATAKDSTLHSAIEQRLELIQLGME